LADGGILELRNIVAAPKRSLMPPPVALLLLPSFLLVGSVYDKASTSATGYMWSACGEVGVSSIVRQAVGRSPISESNEECDAKVCGILERAFEGGMRLNRKSIFASLARNEGRSSLNNCC
jgi:hypothetical protein